MNVETAIHEFFNKHISGNCPENIFKEKPKKIKIIKRFKSCFYETLKPYRTVKWNTHMDYLVQLPSGQNVWMTEKEVKQRLNGEI